MTKMISFLPQYSQGYRVKIAELVRSGTRTLDQLAEESGLDKELIRSWIDEMDEVDEMTAAHTGCGSQHLRQAKRACTPLHPMGASLRGGYQSSGIYLRVLRPLSSRSAWPTSFSSGLSV